MHNLPEITVFTPTYNRKDNLERVYVSLQNQSSENFVWQIIDDGSTDGTQKVVEKWISDDKFPIEYIKKVNGGKTSAQNLSMDITYTPYWICLDSDDTFVEQGIEVLSKYTNQLNKDNELYGLIGLRYTDRNKPMQDQYIPSHVKKTTQLELRFKYGLAPEYYQLYKMEVIKKYKYPEIKGENYFPLSFIPNELDQSYQLLAVNDEVMRIEYQADGITKNKNKNIKRNPIGYTIFKHQMSQYAPTLTVKLVSLISYNSASLISKRRFKFEKVWDQMLAVMTFPFGLIDYLLRYTFKLNLKFEKVNLH